MQATHRGECDCEDEVQFAVAGGDREAERCGARFSTVAWLLIEPQFAAADREHAGAIRHQLAKTQQREHLEC